MKAFGSYKRTYHDCRVYRAGLGRKVLFRVGVKNRKAERAAAKKIVGEQS